MASMLINGDHHRRCCLYPRTYLSVNLSALSVCLYVCNQPDIGLILIFRIQLIVINSKGDDSCIMHDSISMCALERERGVRAIR